MTTKEEKEYIVKKLEELVDGVHAHIDEHLDAVVDEVMESLEENFRDLRDRIAVVEKLEKIEKRVDRVEATSQRYKV